MEKSKENLVKQRKFLYEIEYNTTHFGIKTTIEAPNKNIAIAIGIKFLREDRLVPMAIKNNINSKTVTVTRKYKR